MIRLGRIEYRVIEYSDHTNKKYSLFNDTINTMLVNSFVYLYKQLNNLNRNNFHLIYKAEKSLKILTRLNYNVEYV